MKALKGWSKLFAITKSERNGMILLLILLFIAIILNIYLKHRIIAEDMVQIKVKEQPAFNIIKKKSDANEIEIFDPNTVSVFQLKRYGLPEYVCKNIEKYRLKGGTYHSESDFKKVYGLSDSLYNKLRQYIQFNELGTPPNEVSSKYKKHKQKTSFNTFLKDNDCSNLRNSEEEKSIEVERKIIFINHADSITFQQVRGIGAVLSRRIVNYRNALGGFYSINQLKEVYGLKADIVDNSEYRFVLDTVTLKTIDLNFLELKDLAKHPYISWKDAKMICKKRSENGFINDSQLFLSSCMDSIKVEKMLPYVKK